MPATYTSDGQTSETFRDSTDPTKATVVNASAGAASRTDTALTAVYHSFTLLEPTDPDDISRKIPLCRFVRAATIVSITATLIGTTSVAGKLYYGTDLSAAGTQVNTTAVVVDNATVGEAVTLVNVSIPAGGHLWFIASAIVGTPDAVTFTVETTGG